MATFFADGLPKSEARRLKGHIRAVDALRSLRNEIVHDNVPSMDIDPETVKKGIDSAIHLVEFLKLKLS